MTYFRQRAKSILRIAIKPGVEQVISHLCNDADDDVKLLGIALKETLQNDLSTQEKIWIERIEDLRKELCSSSDQISIVDFGAGSPDLGLSEEKMYSGRTITRTIGTTCRSASVPYHESLLLFKLIRKLEPANCVELGTCLGISASFEAAALKLNGSGFLVTLEGAEVLATLAEGNFNRLGLDNIRVVTGRFQDTLDEVLISSKPIDYVFIDGHHDESATLAYFKKIIPFLAKKSLLVFDDISWSQGMKKAWKMIIADDRVGISVNLQQFGVCLVVDKPHGQKHIRIPLI